MLSGMRPNSAYLKSKSMRIFWVLWLSLCSQTAWAAELLGHISEDDIPLEQSVSPDASPLTYRVLCNPGQTDEPDCDRPPLEDGLEGLQSRSHQQSKIPNPPPIQSPQIEPSLEDWPSKSKSEP